MEWQPIETAPKDGTAVLIFYENDEPHMYDDEGPHMAVARWWASAEFEPSGWGWTDFSVENWNREEMRQLFPTHWRPLPASPEEAAR